MPPNPFAPAPFPFPPLSSSQPTEPDGAAPDALRPRPVKITQQPVPTPSTTSFLSFSSVWRTLRAEASGFLSSVSGTTEPVETAADARKRARTQSIEGGQGSPAETRGGGKRRKRELSEDLGLEEPWGGAPSPILHISQANALAESYETASRSTRVDVSSPPPPQPRSALRPYVTTVVSPPSSSQAPRASSSTSTGDRSLSGKRKVALPSSASSSHLRSNSRHDHHVHFALPTSSSLPNLSEHASSKDKEKARESEPVETTLLGPNGGEVSRAWKEAREQEKRLADKKRIRELEESLRGVENEVKKLKKELSEKDKVIASPALRPPSPSRFRSPFKATAPPPPAPPPPPPPGWVKPRGGPTDILHSARAALRATPPRQKRRTAGIGPPGGQGGVDMDAFLGELSKVKLRKVERKEEKKRAAPDGELTEVLQQAFKRKFGKARDLASPVPDKRILAAPSWSTPRPGHRHVASESSVPVPVLGHRRTLSNAIRPVAVETTLDPRSLDSTTIVFGQAISKDEVSLRSTSTTSTATVTTSTSVFSALSVDPLDAPPEEPAPSPFLRDGFTFPLPPALSSSSPDPIHKEREREKASQRLTEARGRGSPPLASMGRLRPITPGRKKARAALKVQEAERSVFEDDSTGSIKSFVLGSLPSQGGQAEEEEEEHDEGEELMGVGTREKDPSGIVGWGLSPGAAKATSGKEWRRRAGEWGMESTS